MAPSNLSAFPSSAFPQLIPLLFRDEIARVDRILARAELGSCCHEETYRDSGWSCQEAAIVSDLATGLAFCRRHWKAVAR